MGSMGSGFYGTDYLLERNGTERNGSSPTKAKHAGKQITETSIQKYQNDKPMGSCAKCAAPWVATEDGASQVS